MFVEDLFLRYGVYSESTNKIIINCTSFDIETQNYYRNKINVCHSFIDGHIIIEKSNVIDFFGNLDINNKEIFKLFELATYNQVIKCDIVKVHVDAIIPTRLRATDVGLDLTVIEKVKDINEVTTMYDTGLKISPQNGYYSKIYPRSSLIKSGYMLTNSVGIIDANYRGTLKICLTKVCKDSPDIVLPFKCCQLIFEKQLHCLFNIVNKLDNTERNEGGFGSTN
jgi:deoxyuridine 5'-triphosphate nucleotidohydrolase